LYLSASIALTPALILGSWALERLVPTRGVVHSVVAGILLLVGFSLALPLLRLLERGLERMMFARQHGAREALLGLSKELASLLDLGELGRRLPAELVGRIPVMRAALYLYNAKTGPLDRSAETVSPAGEDLPVSDQLDPVLARWVRRSAGTMV